MTIDEAIEYEKMLVMMHAQFTDSVIQKELKEEAQQRAEWLEELKRLSQETEQYIYERSYKKGQDKGFSDGRFLGYNKAIDDFVKEICKMIVQSENNGNYRFYAVEIKQAIADLAEQLKAGEVDG